MNIRPATKQDASQIKDLILELGYDTPEDEIARRINIYTDSGDAYILVVEVDDSLVGLIAGYLSPYFHRSGNIFRIMAIVIATESQRMGIGTSLCEIIEIMAQDRRCDRIEVTAGGHRAENAHRFYQKVGFIPYDGVRFLKDI